MALPAPFYSLPAPFPLGKEEEKQKVPLFFESIHIHQLTQYSTNGNLTWPDKYREKTFISLMLPFLRVPEAIALLRCSKDFNLESIRTGIIIPKSSVSDLAVLNQLIAGKKTLGGIKELHLVPATYTTYTLVRYRK
jgi:hypothetical protein